MLVKGPVGFTVSFLPTLLTVKLGLSIVSVMDVPGLLGAVTAAPQAVLPLAAIVSVGLAGLASSLAVIWTRKVTEL